VRALTPTENKRFNEMIGFVGLSLAILLALSLLSYSPLDPSFDVSAPALASGAVRNWIGPVGAHISDLLFQFAGYAAFLIPVGMFVVAMRWFRSHLIAGPISKLVGSGLLFAFLAAELSLIPVLVGCARRSIQLGRILFPRRRCLRRCISPRRFR
jgi:S-DNA-T family DNA segregation ATPase FtsK/SpoIIIE